jgi:hypothetical protein
MFDRESGQMSICGQIAGGADFVDQPEKNLSVLVARGYYLNIR